MTTIISHIFQCLEADFAPVNWTYLSDKFRISRRQTLHKHWLTIVYLLVNLQINTSLQTQVLAVFRGSYRPLLVPNGGEGQ